MRSCDTTVQAAVILCRMLHVSKEPDMVEILVTLHRAESLCCMLDWPMKHCLCTQTLHETIAAVHVGKLQKHLKSLQRCCHAGQPVCPGHLRQSCDYPIFSGQTSM